ncbi:hypothetical protein [Pseudonocardia kongjuensis]|uniref:hypothetical protein n=1 Tax=Pseudonocardia kongjuensis TaxID=102227 RepID=UPI0031D74118
MRSLRAFASLLLLALALLVCAGPAAAGPPPGHTAALGAADCPYHPPSTLHAGDSEQVPRRGDDGPPVPDVAPATVAVALAPAVPPDTVAPAPPERTLRTPSPVEHLCVDRN